MTQHEPTARAAGMDVKYVARLARLDLTDEEVSLFTEQLGHIVEYVNKIREVDVDGIEPMSHAVRIQNVFRRDEQVDGLARETALEQAPARTADHFRVPLIVE